jgi:NitT/TauT family transport system permease protein
MRIAFGNLAIRVGSVILFFLAWEAAARLAASRQLPSASAVITTLANEVVQGGMLHHLGMTLLRVLISFVLAMSIGTLIGFLMGRWRAVDAAFDSWVLILLNLPALVVTVLAYIWFGLTEVAAIGAVAATLPTWRACSASVPGVACATSSCRSSRPFSSWRRDRVSR